MTHGPGRNSQKVQGIKRTQLLNRQETVFSSCSPIVSAQRTRARNPKPLTPEVPDENPEPVTIKPVTTSIPSDIKTTQTVSQGADEAVAHLRGALVDAPAGGRGALLEARAFTLKGNASDDACRLLVEITKGMDGVNGSAIAALASVLHPNVLVKAVRDLSRTRTFATRYICEHLQWRDAMPLIADLRDGRMISGLYLGFEDDLISLALLLATQTEHDGRDLPYELHRRRSEETVLLFGAAREPYHLLREILSLKVVTAGVAANDDEHLLRWAIANPALTGEARAYCIRRNTPRVIAVLLDQGVLKPEDAHIWFEADESSPRFRVLSALNLPADVRGSSFLRRAAIASCADVSRVCKELSMQAQHNLAADLVGGDPLLTETVRVFFESWQGDMESLLDTAHLLEYDRSGAPSTYGGRNIKP